MNYNIIINMKKFILFIALILLASTADAQLFKKKQTKTEPEYALGMVPVTNGKVTFEEIIPADGLTTEEILERADKWIKERYVEPTVLSVKRYDDASPGSIIIKGEEYIVFKNTFLVLSRARIYYYLTITAENGTCRFNMSRITYWYDDEDDKGGINMKAENWITDDVAFNKNGGLKKFEGKFRRKTIDLKNSLIKELKEVLTK